MIEETRKESEARRSDLYSEKGYLESSLKHQHPSPGEREQQEISDNYARLDACIDEIGELEKKLDIL